MPALSSFIPPAEDPMGAAIRAFYEKGRADKLQVFSSLFEEDEIPVPYLFRSYPEMTAIEQEALRHARGRILDIGAGAGCHSLALQEMGKEVEAIDVSSLAVEVMRARGVVNARVSNILDEAWGDQYDTLLLLMNGAGLAERLSRLAPFLQRLKRLLDPQGQILLDSSDLRFIFEDEAGNIDLAEGQAYYGEVDFQMQYGKIKGAPFQWLYVDYETLAVAATAVGLRASLLFEGENKDYLARLALH